MSVFDNSVVLLNHFPSQTRSDCLRQPLSPLINLITDVGKTCTGRAAARTFLELVSVEHPTAHLFRRVA